MILGVEGNLITRNELLLLPVDKDQEGVQLRRHQVEAIVKPSACGQHRNKEEISEPPA